MSILAVSKDSFLTETSEVFLNLGECYGANPKLGGLNPDRTPLPNPTHPHVSPPVYFFLLPGFCDRPSSARLKPVICRGASIKLIVEVVSRNCQNDYARKTEDYALLGIPEYWILDCLGLGGRDYIGTPKQPTITHCVLVGDRYQKQLLRGSDRLSSPTFPSLQLTAEQIFAAGQPNVSP